MTRAQYIALCIGCGLALVCAVEVMRLHRRLDTDDKQKAKK